MSAASSEIVSPLVLVKTICCAPAVNAGEVAVMVFVSTKFAVRIKSINSEQPSGGSRLRSGDFLAEADLKKKGRPESIQPPVRDSV